MHLQADMIVQLLFQVQADVDCKAEKCTFWCTTSISHSRRFFDARDALAFLFRIAYSGSCSLYMPLALFCKQVWNGTGLSRAAKHEHSRSGTVLLANRATSRWASYIAVTFLRCPRIDINSSAVSSVSRTSRCLWLFKNVFSCLVPEIVSVSLQAMRVRRGRFRMYGVRMLQDLRWRGWPESRR